MPLKAILIDDEQNNLETLALLLKKYCPAVEVVATALNAEEGERQILATQPDIVFLDIQMPGRNGFDLLRSLNSHPFEIIFVTAFDQYGIQAIKFAAIDYLLKPINVEELKSAVANAVEKSLQKKQNLQLENLIHLLQQKQNRDEHRIPLPGFRETRFIRVAEIIRCESSYNYTSFFVSGGEKIVVAKSLTEYDEILREYGFIRVHQSHLVNKHFIKSWISNGIGHFLHLQDGNEIPIARNRKDLVKQALSNRLSGY